MTRTIQLSRDIIFLNLCFVLAGVFATVGFGQQLTPEIMQSFRYRHIGPLGNRTSAVVGVPGDATTCYVGAASGGIWKSTDGGLKWKSIFDGHSVQSIGALAIAPSDPNVVWAGTGEAFIRSNVSVGNGVYKSTDGGKTWRHMGLEKTGRVGRVVIHPNNPDIVHVAALGHCYGPQQERGVFRSTDGGESWTQTLFVDKNTGCFEIAVKPDNPRIMFAGMWPLEIRTWGRESGGPGGGIYKSTDGGATWTRQHDNGLPQTPLGKIGLAFSHSNPEVIYALIETGYPNRGVLWRSSNCGDSWELKSYDRLLNERPHYASRIMVSPSDENEVYFAANSHSVTHDGGTTTERTGWSGDTHDLWADPTNGDRMMISDDGGAMISLNHGRSWSRIKLPNAQMYHVAVDNQVPYYVYGGMQDGPAYKGPNTGSVRSGIQSSNGQWGSTAGGECGFIIPNPSDANIVWGGSFSGGFTRVNYRTGHQRSVNIWPESMYGAAAKDVKFRRNWTFPIAISPHNNNRIYVGSQFIHESVDGGNSWKIISPDLSSNDPTKLQPSGGLTKDNIGVEYACCLFAIAESKIEKDQIWAGTNDGLLHITRDHGKTWVNVSNNIPNLPEWGTISNIEPSRYHPGTCYITVDFHQVNNRDPFVYKTTDFGQSWTLISSNLPRDTFGYAHWVHEDPKRKGMLYLGTENSIYVSLNDGESWVSLQNNLPHAPVSHMVVQEHFGDLVVATYGRGFWIMDDISPLQQWTKNVADSAIHLFEPRDTYRMHSVVGGPRANSTAYINYFLKNKSASKMRIEIVDSNGNLVTTLKATNRPGINRVRWNLNHDPARQAKLRTRPPGNPNVVEEKRFRKQWERDGWYPILSWGTGGGFRGFKVAPGEYTVKLFVGEQAYTKTLVIKKDPRSQGTLASIKKQVEMQIQVRDDLNTTSDMISKIEWMKKQIVDMKDLLGDDEDGMKLAAQSDSLFGKLQTVEDKVFQHTIADGDSKSFRFPNLLYSKLSVLSGDLASSVDFEPNEQQRQVASVLKERLASQKNAFDRLVNEDLAEFNKLADELGGTRIVNPKIE